MPFKRFVLLVTGLNVPKSTIIIIMSVSYIVITNKTVACMHVYCQKFSHT